MMRRFLAPLFAVLFLAATLTAQAGFLINSYISFPPAGGGGAGLSIVNTSVYTNGNAQATTHNVTLPSSIVSGNLLLLFCGINSTPTVTDPTGWTVTLSSAPNDTLRIYSRIADGLEGSTVAVVLNATNRMGCAGYQISGNRNGTSSSEIALSSVVTASTATPDPPSLSPSWGSDANLWVAISFNSDDGFTFSSYPTNYTDFSCAGTTCGQVFGTTTGSGNAGAGAMVAARLLTASSEDPGSFTTVTSRTHNSYTLAVRPAP